jgi:catechol 2,3-dioxygenase-like lactoylglutathione lyase family enzyme
MQNLTFDHYTITVKNLKTSSQFYGEILGLKEIENRTKKPYISWFTLGDNVELHIVEGNTNSVETHIGVHLALKLSDFDSFLNHLRSHNITHHNSRGIRDSITTRADGVRQVYFQDPDGYWIEVNEAAA